MNSQNWLNISCHGSEVEQNNWLIGLPKYRCVYPVVACSYVKRSNGKLKYSLPKVSKHWLPMQRVCTLKFALHLNVRWLKCSPSKKLRNYKQNKNLFFYFDICWILHHCDNWRIKPTRRYLLFYCASYGRVITYSPETTPAQPHLTSNLQQTKKETTNVVINIIVVSSWWWA